MRIIRAYHEGPIAIGDTVILDADESRHIATVLRGKPGDAIHLLDGDGGEFVTSIHELGKKSVSLKVHDQLPPIQPPRHGLACALTKSSAFDDTFQRAVELGMSAFFPLITRRTVIELDDSRAGKRLERWKKLSVESLKQCERRHLPSLFAPKELEAAMEEIIQNKFTPVFLAERATHAKTLSEIIKNIARPCFLIGPEGGWAPEEVQFFKDQGIQAATFGDGTILRTETTVLAALGVAFDSR